MFMISLHPHPVAYLTKSKSSSRDSKDCANCKSKLQRDVYVSTLEAQFHSYRLCQKCALDNLIAELVISVKACPEHCWRVICCFRILRRGFLVFSSLPRLLARTVRSSRWPPRVRASLC